MKILLLKGKFRRYTLNFLIFQKELIHVFQKNYSFTGSFGIL